MSTYTLHNEGTGWRPLTAPGGSGTQDGEPGFLAQRRSTAAITLFTTSMRLFEASSEPAPCERKG